MSVAAQHRTKSHKLKPSCLVGPRMLSVRFQCGCRLELVERNLSLILPKDPSVAVGSTSRKRFIGRLEDGVLQIHRSGINFIRTREGYGLSVHALRAAKLLGIQKIHCETPVHGGYLPSVENLLDRPTFRYKGAGFESQILFKIREIKCH